MGLLARFLHPGVDRHLLVDQGEFIVDEVEHHWITVLLPAIGILACLPVLWFMSLLGPFWPIALVLALALFVYCMVQIHVEYMDRFVITNMRVFRVKGVLSQSMATMPMTRILDISVQQPFWGRIFGYGHLTFESAAQDQGLRDIRYVGRPEERDLTIQRVIQRAGLRKKVEPLFTQEEYDENDDGV